MSFLFQILDNPLVLYGGGAVILIIVVQKFVLPQVSSKFKGVGFEDILAKVLGARYAEARLQSAAAAAMKREGGLAAGRIYEDAGKLQQAVDTYLEGQEFFAAGTVLEKMGKTERAAEAFLQAGDYKKAAQLFAECGKPARAATLFQEKGNSLEAARLYGLAGQWDKSAELYERSGYPAKAAESFEKAGNFVKAAESYEKHFMENVSYATTYASTAVAPEQKSALHAGKLYEKAGEIQRAFQIYERGSFFREAAGVAMQLGQSARAAELYLRAEDLASAADAFEKAGEVAKAATYRGEVAFKQDKVADAARFFQQGQDFLRAAELFESIGMLPEAAGAYEAGESHAAAGSVYVRAGLKDRAGAAYERAGDLATAAKMYEESGNDRKATELYAKSGQTFKGGEAAAKAGDLERAVALLQRVGPGEEDYRAANQILAQTLLKLGRPRLVIERLARVVGGEPVSSSNLELNYWLAVAYEQNGEGPQAVELFRKILAEDLGFRDVEARIRHIESGGPRPAPPEGVASDRIGKYVVTGTLGKGAMGEVVKAHDPALNRDVAVKTISASLAASPEHRERFRREARSVAQLNHPNVVTVFDFGEDGDRIFMAMELLEGEDLRRLIGTPSLSDPDRVLQLAEQICDGLAYAHSKNVVHRDLKPGNVRVLPSGQVKILDFGLARLGASEMTQSGMVLGTPNYMSPEQVHGEHADLRADVFALGTILYEMLTGRKAFEADSVPGVLNRVLTYQPEPVTRVVSTLPPLLGEVVERALAKAPEDRYQSAEEFREALESVRRTLAGQKGATFVPRVEAAPAPAPAVRPATPPPAAPPPAAPPTAQPAAPPRAPTPTAPAAPRTSATTGRFARLDEIGRGPLGVLFDGQDRQDGRRVVLRQLPAAMLQAPNAVSTLVTDLKGAAAVSHPNLARIMGFVEIEGQRYVVSELVPGRTFAEALASGRRLPFPQILSMAKVLAQVLAAIHAKQLVHGSVQPSNVMVAQGVVKLVDFGLGRLAQSIPPQPNDYRAPERQIDVPGDMYGLAAVLYHLLTGVHPKSRTPLVTAGKLVPGVPAAFDQLLFGNLQAIPQARSANAGQFLQMLSKMVATG